MSYKLSNVCTHEKSLWVQIPPHRRSIAQFGRAPRLGREGRRFKSCYSDHICGYCIKVVHEISNLEVGVQLSVPTPLSRICRTASLKKQKILGWGWWVEYLEQ